MKHFLLLAVAAGSLLAQSQSAQSQARNLQREIKGIVTDQNGVPVSAATVSAVRGPKPGAVSSKITSALCLPNASSRASALATRSHT